MARAANVPPPGPPDTDHVDPGVLAGLTDAQRRAVLSEDMPLCVVASAGSGKTRVLTRRVARRVLDGSADARHCLVVTFTRKAAWELHRRLAHLGVDGVRVGTFHGVALGELRRHWADTGRRPPAIVDDPARIVRQLLSGDAKPGADGPGPSGADADRALASEIEWAQASGIDPAGYAAAATAAGRRAPMQPEAVAGLYARYRQTKTDRQVLDLNDIVSEAASLLRHDREVAEAVRWRVRHLFVDEFQDVNPVQWQFVRALLGDRRDLCVVGDPDQAIYSWNGADPTLMTRLPDLLPGTTVIRLDANHRSTQQILAVAQAVLDAPPPPPAGVPPAGDRPTPRTTTQRTATPPTASAAAGRPPLSATGVEGPTPVVQAFDDPADEAVALVRWLRLAHRPGRPWSHLAVLARTRSRLAATADALRDAGVPVRDLTAVDATGDGAPWDGAVVLATFHRSKGLEWPVVALVGLEDGLVPVVHARSVDAVAEEQRLLYVAVTRAQAELWCSCAGRRRADGTIVPARPSPWLAAIAAAAEPPPPVPALVARDRLRMLREKLGPTAG